MVPDAHCDVPAMVAAEAPSARTDAAAAPAVTRWARLAGAASEAVDPTPPMTARAERPASARPAAPAAAWRRRLWLSCLIDIASSSRAPLPGLVDLRGR